MARINNRYPIFATIRFLYLTTICLPFYYYWFLGKSYDECQHDNRYRKSLRRIFWKPIIPLFIEFIKTKYFRNYFRFYKNRLVLLNDNTYSDIVHGNKSQESLSRMNKTFCSFISTNRINLDANVLATIKP